MSSPPRANLPASVRQRLLNLSRQRGESFDLILNHYATERLLYRLSRSEHAQRFIVKGAMLFTVWAKRTHRPTRDLDLLGFGDNSSEGLGAAMRDVCQAAVEPDGIEFDPSSVRVEPIREGDEYQGQRVRLLATLCGARIRLQVDIGIGDVVTPAPETVEYPTLLEFPAPRVRVYRRETMVAEKLQAMVELGVANSRMKDFYDIWTLSRLFDFDGPDLAGSIRSTFERRRTPVPRTPPIALTAQFAGEPGKAAQWSGFIRRSGIEDADLDLAKVVEALSRFLESPLSAAGEGVALKMHWPPGGPWRTR
ncbi:MAG TPA: nucleotidyl transferase AbiEii/AbiGii toxin family protein [Planctomycetota bacterium]|nr:nucleotidyl transferase AbiEii/AbiGii toxin family protein [Planctomycetota bacterium]